MIYIISRAFPRINDVEERKLGTFPLGRWLSNNLPLERLDTALYSFLEKSLRRSRLVVMRMDNWLNSRINRVKKTNDKNGNGNGNHSALFKDIE